MRAHVLLLHVAFDTRLNFNFAAKIGKMRFCADVEHDVWHHNAIRSVGQKPNACMLPWSIFIVLLLLCCCSQASSLSTSSLSKQLRQEYNEGGTIAVLHYISHHGVVGCNDDASRLVQAALEASRGEKGMASGILNAMIGSCCLARNGGLAISFMTAYDDIGDVLKPDLVTLCLAYTATTSSSDTNSVAKSFLIRAEALYPDENLANQTSNSALVDWDSLAQNHGIELLQDAQDFCVLSKSSGTVCYHTGTSISDGAMSLEECLLFHDVPLSTLNKRGRGFVHRIDRGTSGCLVLAKTNDMHARLVAQFFLRTVEKSYQTLVCGTNLAESGTIHLAIQARPATTSYTVEERIGSHVTRLRIKTAQGRRHQVRLHCSKGIGAPILLDPLYGGERILFQVPSPTLRTFRGRRQFCLHADSLSIPGFLQVQAPLPGWWRQVMEEAREY